MGLNDTNTSCAVSVVVLVPLVVEYRKAHWVKPVFFFRTITQIFDLKILLGYYKCDVEREVILLFSLPMSSAIHGSRY